MKLVHWSADIVTTVRGRRQYDPIEDGGDRRGRADKPNGFWVSDEERGAHGWRKYNDFRRYAMRYRHEVELVPNAKILYIHTAEELRAFTDKYGYSLIDRLEKRKHPTPPMPGMIWEPSKMIDGIYWRKLTRKYHGIIITPYIWSQRLEFSTQWYYSWDCASGCIWNPRAIASVKMVKEYKVPHKPTYWELRRKRKRDIERMKALTADLKRMRLGQPA